MDFYWSYVHALTLATHSYALLSWLEHSLTTSLPVTDFTSVVLIKTLPGVPHKQ